MIAWCSLPLKLLALTIEKQQDKKNNTYIIIENIYLNTMATAVVHITSQLIGLTLLRTSQSIDLTLLLTSVDRSRSAQVFFYLSVIHVFPPTSLKPSFS